MSVKENLIAAKALIDTPEKWAKGGGDGVTCFCAVTALNNAGHLTQCWEALWASLPAEAKSSESRTGKLSDIFRWNDADTTAHADVMALFDSAIAAQGSKP